MQILNAKHLVGHFNAHLENISLLYVDEAFWAGDKQGESVLKGLITEDKHVIERKGVDSRQKKNHLSIIMASNSDWVVPATEGERRYFVVDVSDKKKGDHKYFTDITNQMYNEGGLEGMLYELRKMDVSSFNFRDVPETFALQEQKLLSMKPEEKWWYELLCDGYLPKGIDWNVPTASDELLDDYSKKSGRRGFSHKSGQMEMSKFIKKYCGDNLEKVRRQHPDYGRTIHYTFPPLDECRKNFERIMGFSIEWDTVEEPKESVI
jgi:hypothetical protein